MLNPQQRKQQRLAREQQHFNQIRQQTLNQFAQLKAPYSPRKTRPPRSGAALSNLSDMALPIILVMIAGFLIATTSPIGLSSRSLANILDGVPVLGMVALGMTLAMMAGGVDFSVGGVMALSGVIFARTASETGDLGSAVLAALIVGALVGAVQGALIAYLQAPSYIVTIAGLTVVQGAALLISEGQFTRLIEMRSIETLRGTSLGFVPTLFVVFVVVAFFVHFLGMSFGRDLRASGDQSGNQRAAQRSQIIVYTLSALLAAGGGIFLVIRFGSSSPNGGLNFVVTGLAAALIGGAYPGGGRGSILNTVLAVLAIQALQAAMLFLNWPPQIQTLLGGGLIVLALGRQQFG